MTSPASAVRPAIVNALRRHPALFGPAHEAHTRRVEAFAPETQAEIVAALGSSTAALEAFPEYAAAFEARMPDNFTRRPGETEDDLVQRRAADQAYIREIHPGREAARQEAAIAYRLLPSCQAGLLGMLADPGVPEKAVSEFAGHVVVASITTGGVIADGIDQHGIDELRRRQINAYRGMAALITGVPAASPDSTYPELVSGQYFTTDSGARRRRPDFAEEWGAQQRYIAYPATLPQAPVLPVSATAAAQAVATSPIVAVTHATSCPARVTAILHARHVASGTDRVIIEVLYGRMPLPSSVKRRKNRVITGSTDVEIEKYDRRYRNAYPQPDGTVRFGSNQLRRERRQVERFQVYVDATVDVSQALVSLPRQLVDGPDGPSQPLRMTRLRLRSEAEERRLIGTLGQTTSRSDIWLSFHGLTFNGAFVTGSEMAGWLRPLLPADAHLRVTANACLTGGDPRVLAKYPDRQPFVTALQQGLAAGGGQQAVVVGYTRSVWPDDRGRTHVSMPAIAPIRQLVDRIRGLRDADGQRAGEPSDRKVPGTKVHVFTDPLTGQPHRGPVGRLPME